MDEPHHGGRFFFLSFFFPLQQVSVSAGILTDPLGEVDVFL